VDAVILFTFTLLTKTLPALKERVDPVNGFAVAMPIAVEKVEIVMPKVALET
jgi:hypothetical protein